MDRNDDQLSSEERAAFAALERERDPGDLLEERTVRRLRQRGLLAERGAGRPLLTPLRAAIAAAAVIALALGSFMAGHWSGSRQTAEAMLAMRERDTLMVAREVQRAGSAYLAALDALTQAGNADPNAADQGREVALATFHAAASQMISLAPDDPLAGDLLRAIEDRRASAGTGHEKVVWF